MSTSKHKSFRKVLSIESFNTTYNNTLIPCTRIVWCLVSATTSRTIKTSHIGIKTYVGSYKFNANTAIMSRKAISLSFKNPLASKSLSDVNMARLNQKSLNEAVKDYILGDESRCKSLTGTVTWFDKLSGEGMVFVPELDQSIVVYSCNIKGAKTGYTETACMYLVKGETVIFDLFDFGDYLSAVKVSGQVHFDAETWAKLDHSTLAFKKNDDGSFANGLFA